MVCEIQTSLPRLWRTTNHSWVWFILSYTTVILFHLRVNVSLSLQEVKFQRCCWVQESEFANGGFLWPMKVGDCCQVISSWDVDGIHNIKRNALKQLLIRNCKFQQYPFNVVSFYESRLWKCRQLHLIVRVYIGCFLQEWTVSNVTFICTVDLCYMSGGHVFWLVFLCWTSRQQVKC